MKTLLNRYDDPKMSEMIFVGKGDKVFASSGAEEYGFTPAKEYEIQGIDDFGDLIMKNDKGEVDNFTVEYFKKYKPLV